MPLGVVRDADLDTGDDLDAVLLAGGKSLAHRTDSVVIGDSDGRQSKRLGLEHERFGSLGPVGGYRVKMQVDPGVVRCGHADLPC